MARCLKITNFPVPVLQVFITGYGKGKPEADNSSDSSIATHYDKSIAAIDIGYGWSPGWPKLCISYYLPKGGCRSIIFQADEKFSFVVVDHFIHIV